MILAVGIVAGVAGFVFAGVGVPDGTGPNIGAGLLVLFAAPTAIVGAAIGIVGLLVERRSRDGGSTP